MKNNRSFGANENHKSRATRRDRHPEIQAVINNYSLGPEAKMLLLLALEEWINFVPPSRDLQQSPLG